MGGEDLPTPNTEDWTNVTAFASSDHWAQVWSHVNLAWQALNSDWVLPSFSEHPKYNGLTAAISYKCALGRAPTLGNRTSGRLREHQIGHQGKFGTAHYWLANMQSTSQLLFFSILKIPQARQESVLREIGIVAYRVALCRDRAVGHSPLHCTCLDSTLKYGGVLSSDWQSSSTSSSAPCMCSPSHWHYSTLGPGGQCSVLGSPPKWD
jgi:hypothetical protein